LFVSHLNQPSLRRASSRSSPKLLLFEQHLLLYLPGDSGGLLHRIFQGVGMGVKHVGAPMKLGSEA
jgi:hypothetical protein